MPTLTEVFDINNLTRAWRWVRSDPRAAYKGYFRRLYSNYAVSDESLLSDLQSRLQRRVYEPEHACKVYFPKPSGILRPYTLLTVEDQIVYQAMVNVVAEHLHPKVKGRYLVETFSHRYAGKKSVWFYRKWQEGYAAFNNAARRAVADGLRFAASFDLTAFYDSVDHGVLCHFLRKIGCDKEFCCQLTWLLGHWTATTHRIYHNHGIPQGPLGSGMLAEAVLQHFDKKHSAASSVRYLRYVDDIRLFAATERDVRQMLLRLDLLSKSVGLFPQSSKIDIHLVRNIEDELKTISHPSEAPDERLSALPQKRLRKRLVEVTPRFRVADPTEFTYLLSRATPCAALDARLWRILERHPEFHSNILRYFQRYQKLPRKAAERLVAALNQPQLYHAVFADMLNTARGRLSSQHQGEIDKVVKAAWRPKSCSADLLAALGRWAIDRRLFTYSQLENAVRNLEEWWARAELVSVLDDRFVGRPSFESLINAKLTDRCSDVALSAAALAVDEWITVTVPGTAVQPVAARLLEDYKLLGTVGTRVCGVEQSMHRVLGKRIPGLDWRKVFGVHYSQAERQALTCRGYASTDVTAWVNAMDVFNDLLLYCLYKHDRSLGKYRGGQLGSIVGSTKLKSKYPDVQALVEDVHRRRGDSALSHPWKTKAGKKMKQTGYVPFRYLTTAKRLMLRAFSELAAKW